MVWLTFAEDFLLGAWRVRLQHDGLCKLCSLFETVEHALFSCEGASPTWERLRLLRFKASLPPALNNWDLILYGEIGALDRTRGRTETDNTLLDAGTTKCKISIQTP